MKSMRRSVLICAIPVPSRIGVIRDIVPLLNGGLGVDVKVIAVIGMTLGPERKSELPTRVSTHGYPGDPSAFTLTITVAGPMSGVTSGLASGKARVLGVRRRVIVAASLAR